MAGHNLPEQMANEADWEYEELNLTGGTTKVSVVKNGILPVVVTSGTNVLELSDPSRAGIELTIVIANWVSGSLGVTSDTGSIWKRNQDFDTEESSQYYMPNVDGATATFLSAPMYVSGVRTYRWTTTVIQP